MTEEDTSKSAASAAAVPAPLDVATDEASWGYPAFATDFPRTPELDALVASFARGDYRAVREGAPRLAAAATDERVKRAAEVLRARIEPDPVAKLLFVFAAALLTLLTVWWVMHQGPEDGRLTKPSKPASSAVR